MKVFTTNPYTWDESATKVTSGVVSFDIQGVNVSGLSNPISITIPSNAKSSILPTNASSSFFMKPGNLHVHVISVENPKTSIFLNVTPENGSVSFDLLLKFGKRPEVDDYDRKFHLPDLSTCSLNGTTRFSNCIHDPYTLFLGENIINQTGLYYAGVFLSHNSTVLLKRSRRSCFGQRRQKRACVEDKDPPPTPATVVNKTLIPQYDPRTDVNYTVNIKKQTCLYWSNIKQIWTSEGCEVSASLRISKQIG